MLAANIVYTLKPERINIKQILFFFKQTQTGTVSIWIFLCWVFEVLTLTHSSKKKDVIH